MKEKNESKHMGLNITNNRIMELETYDEAIKKNQKPDLNERVKDILKLIPGTE